MSAKLEGGEGAGDFDNQDRDCRFETVATVAWVGLSGCVEGRCCGWRGEAVRQCEEGVPDEGREGRKGAAEPCRKADE